MRGLVFTRLIANSIMVVTLSCVLVFGLMGGGESVFPWSILSSPLSSYSYSDSHRYTAADGKVEFEGVTDLEVDWLNGEVQVVKTDGTGVTVYEVANGELKEREKLHYFMDGSRLKIQFCKAGRGQSGIFNTSKKLVIAVPAAALGELRIETVSAKLSLADITVRDADIESVSGEVKLTGLTCDTLDIESVSGRVEVMGEVRELDVEVVSGSVRLSPGAGIRRLDFESVSGSLHLSLPGHSGFTAQLDTLSGDFSSDFATRRSGRSYIYGDGDADFDFSTVSGDVNIEQVK